MAGMIRYMLDTNIVSYLIRSHPVVTQRVVNLPMTCLCISSITAGELYFGLAKRPNMKQLHGAVREFFRCVEVMPWDNAVAEHYGAMRVEMQQQGTSLTSNDLLIAAHALSIEAALVTNDSAFKQISGLRVEDWTAKH
jgi:tRNA(fMet)-specific endonuclease VapC